MDLAAGAKARASETRTVDAPAELYALEADDFAAAVFDGAAPAVPAADTLGNMRVLDAMRQQIGLQF
jgi:predicted dehydrogenase